MSNKKKYTPIEVVRAVVDNLKPKIKADIERLSKDDTATLFSGSGAQKAKGFGSILSGGSSSTPPSTSTPPPRPTPVIKGEMPDHSKAPASHFVDMIMSKKYQVQEVMKMVPKDKRDDVLRLLKNKTGKKTYKNGLKKYQMEKNCGLDHSKKK